MTLLIIWIICGIISYGATFAYFHKSFPYIAEEEYFNNMRFGIITGLMGPFGFLTSLFMSGFYKHGFKFW